MKIQQLATVFGVSLLLGACATPHKDVPSLDAKIAEITKGDFGQFLYHQSLAEENLAHVRKVKQYWQDDHYWNIDTEKCAQDAAAKAAEHRKMAEEALARWHDNCGRHQEICHRLDDLEGVHTKKLMPVAFFDTGKAVPKSLRQEHIDAVLHLAKDYPNLSLDLIAYTDTVGNAQANQALAEQRAHAVSNVLTQRGLPATVSIHEVAKGEAPGPDNTASAENRRVDVQVHRHGERHEGGHRHHHH